MQPTNPPSPAEIRALRKSAGLTQAAAGALIYTPRRTWEDWEAGIAAMPPPMFELLKLKLAQPPALTLEKPQPPSVGQIHTVRHAAGLTKGQAAALISAKPRAFEAWERGVSRMHPGIFELFCIKTGQPQTPA